MNPDLWLNYTVMVCAWLAILQMVAFMSFYVRAIVPLKKQIKEGGSTLVAPPWKWVLLYHAAFCWVLVWLSGGTFIRTIREEPLPWTAVPMSVGMIVVAWGSMKFARQYAGILRDSRHRVARAATT